MNAWTSAARDELNRFLTTIRQPLEQAGADAAEVIDDIKRHIDEEIAAAELRVVTVTELKPMLARIGEPWRKENDFGDRANAGVLLQTLKENGSARNGSGFDSGGGTIVLDEPAPPKSEPPPPHRRVDKREKRASYFYLIFGVFLPAVTLGIELVTGFCAKNIFDPIPTWGHVFLVALVPIMNALAWIVLSRGTEERWAKRLSLGLGAAIGISIVYSIVYLPLFLPGILALVYFGLGLLPLAPYFAMATALTLRKKLRGELEFTPAFARLRFWPGILAGFLAFLIVDLPYIGTTAAMQMAATPASEKSGLRMLRTFGDEETILRACHATRRQSGDFASVLFWLLPNDYQVSIEEARRIYFQLYGRAFNSVPAPGPRSANFSTFAAERFDPERGGEKVGSPAPGLSMQSSRIDATVEPRAALSYLEWIFEFKNVARSQAEARAEIVLPPGAVVSRLTLWINGEEREAAFAGKAQVREAYQNVVVVQRRDPVLVTTSGKDQILMQCFPVPVNGVMKVRVGMTVPLLLDAEKNGVLRWPYMRERNFALEEKLEHSFWIDSPVPIETLSIPLKTERTASGHYMARGSLNEVAERALPPAVLIRRERTRDESWASDTRRADGSIIAQRIRVHPRPSVKDIVLVVDGSASMQRVADELGRITLPAGRNLRVVVAGDTLREYAFDPKRFPKTEFTGGQDNIPALERAWDLAAENGSGAVIWIHGPQPVRLSTAEGLRQRFERRPNAVQIFDLAIERAANVVAQELPALARYELLSMHRPPGETINTLLNELSGQTPRFETIRERKPGAPGAQPKDSESNLHLARLWAYDEIQRLIRAGDKNAAIELAALYQLVTEVSGAVVLETAEQYARSGLQPVSPNSVPTVPEPGTWALLILGCLMLGGWRRRIKSASPAQT
jgi:hypothetical protein